VEQEELGAEPIRAHRIGPQTLFAPTCPCSAAHYTRHLPRGEERLSARRVANRPTGPLIWGVLCLYSNLARMCQLPVINPMRTTNQGSHQFEDPSEPIYTDPSLFERSRQVQGHNVTDPRKEESTTTYRNCKYVRHLFRFV